MFLGTAADGCGERGPYGCGWAEEDGRPEELRKTEEEPMAKWRLEFG